MKSLKYVAGIAVIATASVGSNAYAIGLGAAILQGTGLISAEQAHALDNGSARLKEAVPIYGSLEEGASRYVNQGVQAAAGPFGSAMGQAVLDPINDNLMEQRHAAVRERMRATMQRQCAGERMSYDPASNQCY